MSDIEDRVRERAYWLWDAEGRPEGRDDEFWFAARQEIDAEASAPPVAAPPEVEAMHGVPTGMPGERIAEQGVPEDMLVKMVEPPGRSATD